MYRKLEALGAGLLGLFVPKVDAAASSASCGSWPACWQCAGPCGYNAPCAGCNGVYVCDC
ncbi:MAG: hypothetical protein HOV94_39470 [Saccharothrix sp.]|nr:hypothetical protein [Saccharothrix sp.]